jgi:hypothetical protein
VFELSDLHAKAGYLHVNFHIPDEVIGIQKVQCLEDISSAQPVEDISNLWERVLVLYKGSIKGSVIHMPS